MSASTVSGQQRQFALRLYRAILKSHREKLPPDARMLGDSYVQSEFKQHKHAKPEHLKGFFEGWMSYLTQLNVVGSDGAALPDIEVQRLDQEKLATLKKLRDEAEKVGEAQSIIPTSL